MAIRFAIGLYAFIALAVFVLAACGDSDREYEVTPTSSPSGATETPPSATVDAELCSADLNVGSGPVAVIGRAVEVSESGPGMEPGFENMFVTVAVERSAIAQGIEKSYQTGDRLEAVLLRDLIQNVVAGDCVSVAGQEQRWACGPDCEDFGFVASFFEVLKAE